MRKRTSDTKTEGRQRDADRQFVTALHRGLEVLRAFRPADRAGLGNAELAARTGLPNSTVSRLTYTLLQSGYLVYDAGTSRYRTGLPVLSLGYACLAGLQLRETARVHMQELADACGDGVLVGLGGRDDLSVTYIAAARSAGMLSLQLDVGSRIPLARSAMGRAYIAGTSDTERAEILDRLRDSHSGPERDAVLRGIDTARDQIARRGFHVSFGDWQRDVHAVSVPCRAPQADTPMLAFNLGGHADALSRDRLEHDLGPRLVELARQVSRAGP